MKLALLSIAVVFALSSCNTMIGIGRDTRLLGEGMEKTASKKGGEAEANTSGAPVY
jgi:predicted small secreted protein